MSSKDLEFLNKWILEVSSLNPPRGKARTDKYNFNPGKLFRDDLAWKLGANYTVTVSDTSRRENFGSPFATDRYVFTITRRAQPEVVGNMLYSITFKGTGAKGRLSINPASIVIVYAIPNPDFISPVVASTPSPLFLCCV